MRISKELNNKLWLLTRAHCFSDARSYSYILVPISIKKTYLLSSQQCPQRFES